MCRTHRIIIIGEHTMTMNRSADEEEETKKTVAVKGKNADDKWLLCFIYVGDKSGSHRHENTIFGLYLLHLF